MTSASQFDDQPLLEGGGLTLRGLREEDRQSLGMAASDPVIWAGHPATDRYKPEVFAPYFEMLLDRGGTLVVRESETDRVIGCSRYYIAPDRPDKIAIGFTFLTTDHWGGRTNFTLKKLMLDHAFRSYDEVWFDIAPTNIRSQKATAKLGACKIYSTKLDLSGTPQPWLCFCLSRDAWQAHLSDRSET